MTDHSLIVSAQWLHEHLDDPQVIIVDCRFSLMTPELGHQQYLDNHIPKAYYLDLNLDLSGPVGKHGGRHPLPNPLSFAQKLGRIGLGANSEEIMVVAYDDARFAFASRLWWLLRYFGHDRVALLDGGLTGWISAGYSVTKDIPPPQLGDFVPQLCSDCLVDINTVKIRSSVPGVVLVDSRESDRYRGEREPIDPIAGHIPGAVNYPWQQVTDAQGYIYSAEVQSQRWAGLEQAEEIIVYCGSGVTACVNLFSLAMAGIHTGKLYAGSWSDWCSYLLDIEN